MAHSLLFSGGQTPKRGLRSERLRAHDIHAPGSPVLHKCKWVEARVHNILATFGCKRENLTTQVTGSFAMLVGPQSVVGQEFGRHTTET